MQGNGHCLCSQHLRLFPLVMGVSLQLLWSAACASCAIPGIFAPVSLVAKNEKGDIVPYHSLGGFFGVQFHHVVLFWSDFLLGLCVLVFNLVAQTFIGLMGASRRTCQWPG